MRTCSCSGGDSGRKNQEVKGETVVKEAFSRLGLIGCVLLISGCASYGVLVNEAQVGQAAGGRYSIADHVQRSLKTDNDLTITMAFSGGGTRAAAFSYGVLDALRDTQVVVEGQSRRLLDEVDFISAVSGGSFTAAYYGLYGDRIFDDFETEFLRRDVQGGLIRRLFNPLGWFRAKIRTELAIEHYEEHVFKGATFADMVQDNRPLIAINASDLTNGVRFSFLQEYFDLLCSDLSSFPVSRAVAASSAVPVLFSPVVVENHSGCTKGEPDWLTAARVRTREDYELALSIDSLGGYIDKDKSQFAHLVDGGITDNLGVRAQLEIVEFSGGASAFIQRTGQKIPRRLVLIVVNASTVPEYEMSRTHHVPSLEETIDAVTDIQLHRYNAATLELLKKTMTRWAEELSAEGRPVEPYFVEIGFDDVAQPDARMSLNQVPTSFSLTDEQVDQLIQVGQETLLNNPEFRRLLNDLEDN